MSQQDLIGEATPPDIFRDHLGMMVGVHDELFDPETAELLKPDVEQRPTVERHEALRQIAGQRVEPRAESCSQQQRTHQSSNSNSSSL